MGGSDRNQMCHLRRVTTLSPGTQPTLVNLTAQDDYALEFGSFHISLWLLWSDSHRKEAS